MHRCWRVERSGSLASGGAGKTTSVVLIARALAQAGYTACIFDADSTNIGVHQALGVHQPPAPLIDYFGGMIFNGGPVTCPVDDPTPGTGLRPASPACETARLRRRREIARRLNPTSQVLAERILLCFTLCRAVGILIYG